MRRIQFPNAAISSDPTDFLAAPLLIDHRDPNVIVKEVTNPDGTVSMFASHQPSARLTKDTQTDITGDGISICSEVLGRSWLSANILGQYFDIINTGPLKERNGLIMDPLTAQLIKNTRNFQNYFIKHDYSALKYLIIPVSNAQFVNEKGHCHWSVLAFCKNSKTFYYFDSLKTHNLEDARSTINKLLKVFSLDKEDPIKICKSPEQHIGFECGVYAIITVERLVKDIIANKGINGNCMEGISLNEVDILKKRCLLAYVLQNKDTLGKDKIFFIMLENFHKKEKTERDQKRNASKNAAGSPDLVKGTKINSAIKNNKTKTSNSGKGKKSPNHKN